MLYCCSRSAPFVCMRLCCREAITRDYRWLRTTMSHKLYRLMTTFTIRGRSFHIFYIGAIVKLQDHYTIRPDKLTEKQVQQYIFWLRDQKKVAKGTFQSNWAGIKFFYYHNLGVDWPLFTRKKVRQPLRKQLPVPIAWEDGHRLIAALKRPDYQFCRSLFALSSIVS